MPHARGDQIVIDTRKRSDFIGGVTQGVEAAIGRELVVDITVHARGLLGFDGGSLEKGLHVGGGGGSGELGSGGGSSYTEPSATNVTLTQGYSGGTGTGSVVISW
ncbi:MAG: hypothetical protein WCB01_11470 [Candidatus Cybelea sp.]